MGRRWGALLVGLMLLAGAQGMVGAAGYPTYEACWEAEQVACSQTDEGWVPTDEIDTSNTVGTTHQYDEENLKRQGMTMGTNTYGTKEHPVVAVDMNQVIFPDVQPYLDLEVGRVRVPVRFVSEQMGANVEWIGETQTVIITQGDLRIQLRVDDPVVLVNDKEITIDAPPRLVDPGRVMVPLRFISEAFGALVDWVGTETPDPMDHAWGHYQVWIWIDNGYWGKYDLHERLLVQSDWFYRGPGKG